MSAWVMIVWLWANGGYTTDQMAITRVEFADKGWCNLAIIALREEDKHIHAVCVQRGP